MTSCKELWADNTGLKQKQSLPKICLKLPLSYLPYLSI